ncbi:MAG: glycyl-radical enzyme activating protein [Actinobacteria bacterium RBG_13_35_12]|uniref:Glycyl-radical enzyme activating protein n=1 Tax=Candidatus Sediminicultor quintus TaxID=1797291 RepID=A0A1F5AFA8_9BACT|nr:MAG: glycyl-radical enzyme activating protein [Actinobacteria bacterium RBG_13_35_12]OGD17191.1 MAG: glycyl-radical enzyme activating protein [Candidatus Atribacteria bacterium RBG_19FT_COMBO_35_14]OGD31149.1 MAG: glycyl-radical enzyme activating protein [Candidatus Atribacteria bacterium RBG_16_35_8]
MTTGIIFNIQRYSIHDGPGIRTTVFLKGCPLSCWWCQNPESQLSGQEMIFWGDRCISCGACSAICPSSAIQIKNGIPITEKEKCILCGKCIEKCPALAREMIGKKMTVESVIKEIEKDLVFYEESDGGVTFSGGEPLGQSEFLESLLNACQEKKIHTAVDTSGYISWEILEKVAPKVNLFLYDLKIMDSERHRKYTGVSNEIILENLKKLSSAYHNISVRFPVIPGINDDDQNIRETGEFLSSLKITQVNLLPYHYIGIDKYKRLGRTYKLVITQPPSEEKLSEISGILSKFNLKVKLRG